MAHPQTRSPWPTSQQILGTRLRHAEGLAAQVEGGPGRNLAGMVPIGPAERVAPPLVGASSCSWDQVASWVSPPTKAPSATSCSYT
eukprot:3350883-Pyramimonas_sp.AAC.1